MRRQSTQPFGDSVERKGGGRAVQLPCLRQLRGRVVEQPDQDHRQHQTDHARGCGREQLIETRQ